MEFYISSQQKVKVILKKKNIFYVIKNCEMDLQNYKKNI